MRSRLEAVDELLRETRDAFAAAGMRSDRISGGSTPTRYLTHETCVNELRSGTLRAARPQRSAAREVRAVGRGDRHLRRRARADRDRRGLQDADLGHAPGRRQRRDRRLPGADLHTINEEHGYVGVAAPSERPALGSHLQVIPNHACGCVNLHEGLLAVRDGVVDHVIDVSARGLVR